MATIIGIDIETNRLPTKDRDGNPDFSVVYPLSFGWELQESGVLVDGGGFFINHNKPEAANTAEAFAVNKIRPEDIASGETPTNAANLIVDGLKEHAFFCGHNIMAFDLPVLRHHICETLCYGAMILDTRLIYAAFHTGMRRGAHEDLGVFYGRVMERSAGRAGLLTRLEHICEDYGIDYSRAHNAQADAGYALEALSVMRGRGIIKRVLNIDI